MVLRIVAKPSLKLVIDAATQSRRTRTRRSKAGKTSLVVARAALSSSAILRRVLNRVHDFEEGRGVGASRLGTASGGGLGDGDLDGASRARAALGLFASRLLALQLALGLGAVGGLGALLVAGEFFADWSTLGLRSLAGGVALGRLADRLALGASLLLTLVLGAADRANGLLAVNGALGASCLFALHLALGTLANRVAHSRARRIVTLPLAIWVALLSRDSTQSQ